MRDDVVMMLTERGMRILIEEMSKGSQPQEVFKRLSQEEPEQEEVDQLVKDYLDYKKNSKPENYKEKQDKELREVIRFLTESGEPQKLANIREHMIDQGLGLGWTVKASTQRMQKLMRKEPNIIHVGYGKYTYYGGETIGHSSEGNETGEVQET